MNSPNTALQSANTFSTFMAGDGVKKKINEIIGGKKGDAFVTAIVSSVSNNPNLAACDKGTILSAGLQGAALDLSPSPTLGHFYMVPFEDRKNNRTVATFQLGYKGYIQLAIRSGQYKRINVIAIKDGELVTWNPLTEELFSKLISDDGIREQTPTTGYYASFELINGFVKTMYWSRAKMEAHALKYSKGYAAKKGYTFWEKDFDGMAFKTMLRQLLSKWGVMSVELQRAFEADTSVLDEDGRPNYFDNEDPPQQSGSAPSTAGQPEQKPAYPEENFKRNFDEWVAAIKSGKKTVDQIKTTVARRGDLTADQIDRLTKATTNISPQGGDASAQGAGGAGAAAQNPGITYAQVEDQLIKAKDLDLLGAAADLIGEIADPKQREELTATYLKRKSELAG